MRPRATDGGFNRQARIPRHHHVKPGDIVHVEGWPWHTMSHGDLYGQLALKAAGMEQAKAAEAVKATDEAKKAKKAEAKPKDEPKT